jgi:amidase
MPAITLRTSSPIDNVHGVVPRELPKWRNIVRSKRESRDAAIPPEWRLRPGQVEHEQLNVLNVPKSCGILTARELEITQEDAVLLVQKILNREYSSYEVRS